VIVPSFLVLSAAKGAYTSTLKPIKTTETMAKPLPKLLTNRTQAHLLISKLQHWQIKFQGWRDARSALRAKKRYKI
jgi:hypothetical protein